MEYLQEKEITILESPQPKLILNRQGFPILMNKSCKKLWRIESADTIDYIANNYSVFHDEQLEEGIKFALNNMIYEDYIEIPEIIYNTEQTTSLKNLDNITVKISGYIHPVRNIEGEVETFEVTLFNQSDTHDVEFDYKKLLCKFQNLVTNVSGVVYEYIEENNKGYFKCISDNCQNILGVKAGDVVKSPAIIKKILHPDDKESCIKSFSASKNMRSEWKWEGRVITRGLEKWVRVTSMPEQGKNGTMIHYGIIIDITKDIESERLMFENIQRLELAIKGANLGLWDWFVDEKSVIINDRFAEILGYQREELSSILEKYSLYYHPDDLRRVRLAFIMHLKGNTDFFEVEVRIKNKNDNWVWVKAKGKTMERSLKGRSLRVTGTIQNIEDRKRNELQLIQSEKKYKELVKNSPLGVVVHQNGKILFANEKAHGLIGLEQSGGLVGKSIFEFIDENHQLIAQERIERVVKSNETVPYIEMIINKPDGKHATIEVLSMPIEYEGEQAVQAIFNDITDRKSYENRLIESEQKYKALVDYSPLAVTVHFENNILFANKQTANLLGEEIPEKLIGRDMFDFVHDDHKRLVKKRIKNINRKGDVLSIKEEKLVRSDGREVIVESIGMPIMYEGKQAIQSIARDITDKKRVESTLKRNEQLFTQLFKIAPIAIVLLDENKKITQINQGFTNIFGYIQDEVHGKNLTELIVPKEHINQAISINSLVSKGELIQGVESVRKNKTGELIQVIIYGVPVKLQDKEIGIYGIYVDISSNKKVEENLKTRNEELDNFVYRVSHDLRGPLASILGIVHLANLEENKDDLKGYLNIVGDSISKLDDYTQNVLSHNKNLNTDVVVRKVDFKETIRETFLELGYLPNSKMVEKKVTVGGEEFYSDRWRIKELLTNLASNAIKYCNLDNEQPYIKVEINVAKEKVKIMFSDNGVGIEPTILPNIFEMFYRGNVSSVGSGLGLYIVKKIIEKLDGKIETVSTVNVGTTFIVTLPNLKCS